MMSQWPDVICSQVIRVQKRVRYVLARNKLLKLVKEAKDSKDKSFMAARHRKNVFFEIVSTEQSCVGMALSPFKVS